MRIFIAVQEEYKIQCLKKVQKFIFDGILYIYLENNDINLKYIQMNEKMNKN